MNNSLNILKLLYYIKYLAFFVKNKMQIQLIFFYQCLTMGAPNTN